MRSTACTAPWPGTGDRELADRSGAEDGDDLAATDVAELGAHVAGREDVREEQDLLVLEVVLDLQRADVREWHARILGLPAGVAAREVRVAEDSRGGVAEQLLSQPRVRVGVLAQGEQLLLAVPAVSASDRERNDDAVANLQVRDAAAGLHDLAHELVAEDIALLHRRDEAVVQVKIRAADRGRGHAHDGVTPVHDRRIRHVVDAHVVLAVPAGGSHGRPP
jgi:hypothetical protein